MKLNNKQITGIIIISVFSLSFVIVSALARDMSFRIEMDNNTKEAIQGLNSTIDSIADFPSDLALCDYQLDVCSSDLSACNTGYYALDYCVSGCIALFDDFYGANVVSVDGFFRFDCEDLCIERLA